MKKEPSFYSRWLSMVVFSVLLLGLVGYASDQTSGMFEVSIISVIVLTSVFHVLFGSSSSFFNVVFANGMTIYLCFFTFFVESIFFRIAAIVYGCRIFNAVGKLFGRGDILAA